MFKGIYDSLVQKISDLNPIRHFIKYALDKTLNEFLSKELTHEDFKNGPLNLHNIEINCEKINKQHLISSPYILHSGVIGYLKISLPPLSQISTKSIEVTIENVQISLKPNKKFAQSFKEKMFELNQMKKFYVEEKEMEGQISENGPVDFFKQLLKNIIMNIKIKVKNIAIRLYMNTPSSDGSHPQYFTLLRIPTIQLQKKEEKQIKKNEVDEIKFNLVIPQITFHLLREDVKYPEYGNLGYQQGDFPFAYPPVEHPSTILLIGCSDNITKKNQQNESSKSTNFNFCLTTDYIKKNKQLALGLEVENFSVMVDPVQIKILSRFVVQILQFKKILQTIINEIKMETGQSLRLTKKKSDNYQGNNDFFSSLMMSINSDFGSGGLNNSRNTASKDLFQSIIDGDSKIKKDVLKFNEECRKTFMQSKEYQLEDFQAINFKNIINISAEISTFHICIMKYGTVLDFKRTWPDKNDNIGYNSKIGCSHFLLIIEKAHLLQRINEKILDANFKNLKIYNVKLKELEESSIEDYHDLKQSVQFYSMCADVEDAQQFIRSKPDLLEFKLKDKSHYCIQEIVKISHEQQQQTTEHKQVKKYNLIPKLGSNKSDAYILYKPGFSIHFDKKQNYVKINMEIITVSVNLQICEDLLNIAYPLFMYRRISDLISYKREELNIKKTQKKSLLESQYDFRIDMMKSESEQEEVNKRDILILQILQVKLGFRKGKAPDKFSQMTKKNKQKIYDEDSFNKNCFCNLNDPSCLYVEFYSIQIKKKSMLKLSCKEIQVGLYQLHNSTIISLSSILILNSLKNDDGLKIFKQDLNCKLFTIFAPCIKIKVTEEILGPVLDLIKDNLKIFDHLMAYKHYLENQMSMIQHHSTDIMKKNKKVNNTNTDVEIKLFISKIFIDCEFLLMRSENIYFTKFSDGLIAKVSSLVIGLKREVKPKLCEFKNQLMMITEYPSNFRYSEIPDSDIILQISDQKKSKPIFKSLQKQLFFEKLSKQTFSIEFSFFKKETDRFNEKQQSVRYTNTISGNKTVSQKFKFNKFNSAIEEQGERLLLNLQLNQNVYFYLCNALDLIPHKALILGILDKVKLKNKEIMELKQKSIIMERKHSAQIENESIEIKAKFCPVIVDIRPDFICKDHSKIYGPTRSVAILNPGQTLVHIDKEKQLNHISTSLGVNVQFLYSEDREIDLNPLLLKDYSTLLATLGFKSILQIPNILIQVKNSPKRNVICLKFSNILAEASIRTLIHLKLHAEHLVNHHIKNTMGMSLQQMYESEQFCTLEDDENSVESEGIIILEDEEEIIIEDISQALLEYQQKLNKKKKDESAIKTRVFQPNYIKDSFLCIQSIRIQKMTVRIGICNDFDFIKVHQMGNSIIERRARVKELEQQRYLTISLSNFQFIGDLDSSLPHGTQNREKQLDIANAYLSAQKLKVTLSKQKSVGHTSLRLIEQQIQQQIFTIFNNEYEFCLVVQNSSEKLMMKSYALKVKLGLTSEVKDFIFNTWQKQQKQMQRNGWKKIYETMKKIKKQKKQEGIKKLLIMIPESTVKLSLQYENIISILEEQNIVTSELLLNEQFSNQYAIKRKVNKWIKQLIKDNLGSVISRTALNLIVKLFSEIFTFNLNCIGKVLGMVFGNSE